MTNLLSTLLTALIACSASLQAVVDIWSNQGVSIETCFREDEKTPWSVETIQPVKHLDECEGYLPFFQGRCSRSGGYWTHSLGIGSRHLISGDCFLIGWNAFFDWTDRKSQRRYSLGAELLSSSFRLRFNLYNAYSGRRRYDYVAGLVDSERVLDGYDIEGECRVPYFPWIHLIATGYHWKGHSKESIRGGRASLLFHLSSNFSIEAGKYCDNYRDDSFACLYFHLARPWDQEYALSDCCWGESSASHLFLSKIRRRDEIIIEQRRARR